MVLKYSWSMNSMYFIIEARLAFFCSRNVFVKTLLTKLKNFICTQKKLNWHDVFLLIPHIDFFSNDVFSQFLQCLQMEILCHRVKV